MLDQKLALYKGTSNKCQRSVLTYLAEEGSKSIYTLAKQLGYQYPYMHEETKKLNKKWDLVRFHKESVGYRMKKMVDLNFKGIIGYLLTCKDRGKEAKKKIAKAIANYPHLISFSQQWVEIEEIMGGDPPYRELISAALATSSGNYVNVKTDPTGFRFKAFVPGLFSRYIRFRIGFKRKNRNQKFGQFLALHDELKKAYVSFLAIQDILDVSEGMCNLSDVHKLMSERELAFFEDRNIEENRILPERLEEFFPKYALPKHMFTGIFLTKLLWEPIEKKPTGFHVSLV